MGFNKKQTLRILQGCGRRSFHPQQPTYNYGFYRIRPHLRYTANRFQKNQGIVNKRTHLFVSLAQ